MVSGDEVRTRYLEHCDTRRAEPGPTKVLLVPSVGFDSAGYRLGHGGGYYDRTLASFIAKPFTIGIGYELGRLETIHPQLHGGLVSGTGHGSVAWSS